MKTKGTKYRLEDVKNRVSESDVLSYIETKEINWKEVNKFKKVTGFTDEVISGWFNMNVKTFRSYKKPGVDLNINFKEKFFVLSSIFEQGKKVFGNYEAFTEWLDKENFYFNGKSPLYFLNTITGARFVEDRLIAMEYGDNV
ncbi:MbcA/ParS/Xre antitoxin family protein [Gramella sp. AN32]|uniref:Antitoxin Xre/MbcA/ParS toxin-binding domain-containing protein n=1 Tax=Christiangramia antarctica TaxID=2058158 RepID=A0ABW5X320_9FLAO|nr:MbcA/ParS/Xre antitoxin family protein [Gramella sp. AN32]MCM4157697.1 DUF2384 domain-containing protein [Gramella sp. AN32]